MPDSLQQALERAAQWNPAKRITFLDEREIPESLTYAQLFEEARVGAGRLQWRGVQPGNPVMLSLASNWSFVAAFWSCLLAGAVPVPLPAAGTGRKSGPVDERIANARRILGDRTELLTDETWDDRDRTLVVGSVPEVKPDDTALIQFSSGSTGAPRGIVLSQRNILANLRAIVAGAQMKPEDTALTWMPLHHDLGLIGFLLSAVYCPCDLFLMETGAFIRKPSLWLDWLERTGATLTAAPNFGQALLLSRLKDTPRRDLSRVRVMINGAEPISVDVMRAFMSSLAPHGLRPEAMFPVYGLAEATLAVTFPPMGEEPRVARLGPHDIETVSEGSAVEGCEIRIVDSGDRPLAEGIAGHIQVRGENVTAGYYCDPEATQAAFCDGWLRTGDLGVIREGRLYVTGRAKDILFVNGENVHSTDIENVAMQAVGMERRRVAAVGWRGPHDTADRLLVFISSTDVERDAPIFAAVRQHLQSALGLTPRAIVPMKPSQFPRTTSGKIQRYLLRERFEEGRYRVADDELPEKRVQPPRTPAERRLHAIWARELGLKPDTFGIQDEFDHLGGRSLTAALILGQIDDQLGIRLPADALQRSPTVAAMAALLDGNSRLARLPGARKNIFQG